MMHNNNIVVIAVDASLEVLINTMRGIKRVSINHAHRMTARRSGKTTCQHRRNVYM